MTWLFLVLIVFPSAVNSVLYIDRFTVEANPAISNLSVAYITDEKGNAVTNASFDAFVTVTKILVYVRVRLAEDQNDREYKREFLRTVIDVTKMFSDSQTNFLLKGFTESLRQFMDFEIKFPLPPVRTIFQ